jgi:hypothetical protein
MKRCIYTRLWTAFLAVCAASLLLALCIAHAQEIHLDNGPAAGSSRGQRVALDPETYTVTASHPDWIELRFYVAPGFHINSHTPHDETLIPTVVHLAPSTHVQVLKDEYPAGIPLHLNIGAGQTLSTYTNEFRVRMQVVAAKGNSELTGNLHYQACDAASCFPPRDLPITVPISAR